MQVSYQSIIHKQNNLWKIGKLLLFLETSLSFWETQQLFCSQEWGCQYWGWWQNIMDRLVIFFLKNGFNSILSTRWEVASSWHSWRCNKLAKDLSKRSSDEKKYGWWKVSDFRLGMITGLGGDGKTIYFFTEFLYVRTFDDF